MKTSVKSAFDLATCARPNILALQPYRCARDDYKDDGTNILLDANENAYGPALDIDKHDNLKPKASNGTVANGNVGFEVDYSGLNRYPDPHQVDLKQLLCNLRNTHVHTNKSLTPDNLFVGVGSDEAIDNLLRCFCVPGRDKILVCPPTYGMYMVSAQVNDVEVVRVPLDPDAGFALRPDAVSATLAADPSIKLVYLCSPGNPSGALISKAAVAELLQHQTWNGVVVVDEAYIDFAPDGSSLAEWVVEWPNLVVMQTLSKAFGLAGIRLGVAFASPPVARLLNNLKAPYNISSMTSQLAMEALTPQSLEIMRRYRSSILEQRSRLIRELPSIPGVGKIVGGTDANFLMVPMLDGPRESGGQPSNEVALRVYEGLAERKGVVVRFRGKEYGCPGCLRITVGTSEEIDRLLPDLKNMLEQIHAEERGQKRPLEVEDGMERAANDVVA